MLVLKVRKPNADAICTMALENFVEMRDKTADAVFLAKKKVPVQLLPDCLERHQCSPPGGVVSMTFVRRLRAFSRTISH